MRWGLAWIALALLSVGPSEVRAEPPPAGKLVFAGNHVATGDTTQNGLFVVNADGTGLTHVTHSFSDEDPHWSPDGTVIAFVRSRSTGDAIELVGTDGSSPRVIGTGSSFGVRELASDEPWSPDGTQLAWLGCGGLCVENLHDRTQRKIPFASADASSGFAWSPDATRIAAVDGSNRLLVVPAAGGAARVLARGIDEMPSWAPDGSAIAVESGSSLALVDPAGGGKRILATDVERSPVWSPDGRSILYLGKPKDDRYPIEVVDAASGASRTVVETGSGTSPPVWAPDGTAIAYTESRWHDHSNEPDVWIVRADGTGAHPVTSAYPTGAEYALFDSIDWGTGSVPVTTTPRPPSLALPATAEHTGPWVDSLARAPYDDAVAFARDVICDPDSESQTTIVATWRASTSTTSESSPPCRYYGGGLWFAVTPSLVAWSGRFLFSLQQDERSFVGVAPFGSPQETESRRWLGYREDELGRAPYLGPVVGDGRTVTFETNGLQLLKHKVVEVHRRLYRIVPTPKPHAVRVPLPPGATYELDAADGQILLGSAKGRLLVIDTRGGAVGSIAAHAPSSARIGGGLVGEVEGTTLRVWTVRGALESTHPLEQQGDAPHVLAIRGDYAVYETGIAVHLLRLHDGRDDILDLPGQAGPVDALLTPAGLFVSYDEAYAATPGHVVFVPTSALPR